MRYNKPVYSKEQYKTWEESEKRHHDFMRKHTQATKKVYEINGYYVECIQRKYDACMRKENEYGIRVWTQNPETVEIENINDACVTNDWYNNSEEANKRFLEVKGMCY